MKRRKSDDLDRTIKQAKACSILAMIFAGIAAVLYTTVLILTLLGY